MKFRNDSPNPKPAGKRLINTTELFRKKAALKLELADLGVEIAESRIAGHKGDVREGLLAAAELKRRIAVVGVRLGERIVKVD